ncbi:hypothetical protein H6800_03610 [Candidatus Nomurabacteria bacterium]|nr:hypothetical protein [Candidatus Nomurabacteria bacterium]
MTEVHSNKILDKAFPFPDDEPDIMLGIPDYTDGVATDFFASLGTEDRELIQWYLEQGYVPAPAPIEFYVLGLAKGYQSVDPNRRSTVGIDAAITELQRVGRYVEIFLEASSFFPKIETYGCLRIDNDGAYYEYNTLAWDEFLSSKSLPYSLKFVQESVRGITVPLIEATARFLQDPTSEPEMSLMIETILKEERESLEISSES